MTDKRDEQGKLLSDELRMTPIGRFVRHTSLDELPQLLNVLKGDMSVGWATAFDWKVYTAIQQGTIPQAWSKPGITGWAQVNGRNNISWAKKFELDVWYVNHLTFILEIKILWMTLIKVIKRKDITTDDPAAFEPFNEKN